MRKGMEKIKVTAPVPGTCPVCASVHEEQDPHDLNSLYYQNQFFKAYKRFPTWEDALHHCSPITNAVWAEKLKKDGIEITILPDEQGEA